MSDMVMTSYPGLPPRLFISQLCPTFLHGCEIKSGREAWVREVNLVMHGSEYFSVLRFRAAVTRIILVAAFSFLVSAISDKNMLNCKGCEDSLIVSTRFFCNHKKTCNFPHRDVSTRP